MARAELNGEALTLLAILTTQGTTGLVVGDTAFSAVARRELEAAGYAVTIDGRTTITLKGAQRALGTD